MAAMGPEPVEGRQVRFETPGLSTSMTVILGSRRAQIGMTGRAGDESPPVLYLLHGLSDEED